jgi:hypothetical protein
MSVRSVKLEPLNKVDYDAIAVEISQSLNVDKDRLDLEWEKQPQLYMDWADLHARASNLREKIKTQIEQKEAEIDQRIRTNPSNFGIDKVTESAIKSAIKRNDGYTGLIADQDRVGLLINRLSAVVASMSQKKSALENLTELCLAGFYNSASGPARSKTEVPKTTRSEIISKMNRRSRNKE